MAEANGKAPKQWRSACSFLLQDLRGLQNGCVTPIWYVWHCMPRCVIWYECVSWYERMMGVKRCDMPSRWCWWLWKPAGKQQASHSPACHTQYQLSHTLTHHSVHCYLVPLSINCLTQYYLPHTVSVFHRSLYHHIIHCCTLDTTTVFFA